MKYGPDTEQLRRWVIWFALPMIIGALVAAVMQHPTILVRPLSLLFAIEFTKLTVVLASIHKSKQALDDLYDVPVRVSARRLPCVSSCMPSAAWQGGHRDANKLRHSCRLLHPCPAERPCSGPGDLCWPPLSM